MKYMVLVVLPTGCSGANGGTTSDTEVRRLNHVQAKGTHNSYHKDYATLTEAIAAEGWPTLGALRGKVLFSMLDSENHRAAYTRDAPALEGRLLFVDADQASDPYAALFKINNAQSDGEAVQTLVAAGFIVTSNVDGVTQEDAANTARAKASLQAGVQYSSSDFPAPVSSRDYWFDIPEGNPARCNPVYGSDPCSPNDIENLP